MPPKWAQPFDGKRVCSICSSPDIFFEKGCPYVEITEIEPGIKSIDTIWAIKAYCKDCYEECGGSAKI